MKRILFFMLLVSFVFATSYGHSRITIERTWLMENVEDGLIDFRGALAVNGTNQRVMAVFTEPEMDYEEDENGTIWLFYKGKMNDSTFAIKGTAIVDVDYDTHILSDSSLPEGSLSFTNLTAADDFISAQAMGLSDEQSSLRTVANLVNWVHNAVEYDVSFWGQARPAVEVFQLRKGVCVEYTHLLISMARSLGFETRYVSGYVFANSWQPHAWAEIDIPGYGWLPADATFSQVGILDSSHLAVNYGDDQSYIYDLLLSQRDNATLEVQDKVTTGFFSDESNPALLSIDFDKSTYVTDVSINNPRAEYLYGSYNFLVSSAYGKSESSVLLLMPNENLHVYHGLNHSLFENGYSYNIPLSASFNDATAEETITIDMDNDGVGNGQEEAPSVSCVPSFLLLALVISRAII
jgi:transglutaminase-like putative cysteine protease